MSSLIGRYLLSDLLTKELPGHAPVVDGLLWERDNIILVGKEKTGKSLFSMQLACSLTSCHPFLGEYNIPKPLTVAYIQAEGKLADTKWNFERMLRTIPCDQSKLSIFYYPGLALDTEEGLKHLKDQIDSWQRPDAIFLDPLYMLMQGDLIDNQHARRMVLHLRQLSEYYQALLWIVHHAHRPKFDQKKGIVLEEGDDALFGSFVWKAYPDNVYLLEREKGSKQGRTLYSGTQRLDRVAEQFNFLLQGSASQDDALYFELLPDSRANTTKILEHFPDNGYAITIPDLAIKTGYSRATVWSIINKLLQSGSITTKDRQAHPIQWSKNLSK